jgi:hypothetical protein
VTAQDPQATTGSTAGYQLRPPCRCGHPPEVHKPANAGRLGACSAHTPGACGCHVYRPAESEAS